MPGLFDGQSPPCLGDSTSCPLPAHLDCPPPTHLDAIPRQATFGYDYHCGYTPRLRNEFSGLRWLVCNPSTLFFFAYDPQLASGNRKGVVVDAVRLRCCV